MLTLKRHYCSVLLLAWSMTCGGCATGGSGVSSTGIAAPIVQTAPPRPQQSTGDETVTRLLVKGLTQLYAGEAARAKELLGKALELAPENAAILSALSEAHSMSGDATTAVFFAQQAVNFESENVFYHFQLAESFSESNDELAAIAAYENLLDRFPHNREATYALAMALERQGETERSFTRFKALSESDPRLEVQYDLLRIAQKAGNDRQIEASLVVIGQRDPGNVDAAIMLAELYDQQGRTTESIAILEGVIADHPDQEASRLKLAALYRTSGRVNQSTSILAESTNRSKNASERALELSTTEDLSARLEAIRLLEQETTQPEASAESTSLLGRLYAQIGRKDEAVEVFRKLVQDEPRRSEHWAQLASALNETDQHEEAIFILDDALILFPGHPGLLRQATLAHSKAGSVDEALSSVAQWRAGLDILGLSSDRRRSEILAFEAQARARSNDPVAADSLFAQSIEIDQGQDTSLVMYGTWLLNENRNLRGALAMARESWDLRNQRSAESAWLTSRAYRQLGLQTESEEWMVRTLSAPDRNADILEEVGDALLLQGKMERAQETWSQALELDPSRASLLEKTRKSTG